MELLEKELLFSYGDAGSTVGGRAVLSEDITI